MSKARYSDKHEAHFGLGTENYCHFTSPIRRLSDLAIHRIIKRVLLSGKRPESYASYARRLAICATEGELRAVSAERRIDNLYKTVYMSRYVGKTFSAFVSGVTSFGIFATLDNTVEGIIPLSDMSGSYVFEERTMKLRGSRHTFALGDKITVRLVECDISGSRIRFELVEE
jgi:ribonuclease R